MIVLFFAFFGICMHLYMCVNEWADFTLHMCTHWMYMFIRTNTCTTSNSSSTWVLWDRCETTWIWWIHNLYHKEVQKQLHKSNLSPKCPSCVWTLQLELSQFQLYHQSYLLLGNSSSIRMALMLLPRVPTKGTTADVGPLWPIRCESVSEVSCGARCLHGKDKKTW